jgi:phosphohistidine phosphatase
MLLYLVRHGEAEPANTEGADAARRLTDAGRKDVERVAKRLETAGVRVDRVLHSPAVRAKQTAQILAEGVGGKVSATDDLASPEIEPMLGRVRRESGDLMLVGHVPFMPRLASYLLTGREAPEMLHFGTGAIACLSDEEGNWRVEWIFAPKTP